ncbi:MAG: hypothetical protein Q9N26_03680 [Aquificota bacterium]|nr:hypothetical protein [Aquificota bacterium]
MDLVEEFTFDIGCYMANIEQAPGDRIEDLKRWLGRNEKRFMCILEHHYSFDHYSHLIRDCEKDRCIVNWLKVYKYINILGLQLSLTVYPVILWDVPLPGAHRILYNAQFRYKKGWISKKEKISINGEDVDVYLSSRFPREKDFLTQKIQSEVIKLSDYIISTFFSSMMRCEGIREIMV